MGKLMNIGIWQKNILLAICISGLISIACSLRARMPCRQDLAKVFFIGVATDFLYKYLAKDALEHINEFAKHFNIDLQKDKPEELVATNSALAKYLKSYTKAVINSVLDMSSWTHEAIESALNAYKAGLGLNFALGVAQDLAKAFLNLMKGPEPSYKYDLAYPIRSFHGTQPTWGPKNPYCLQPHETFENALKSLGHRAKEATVSIGSFALGILFYRIAVQLGEAISDSVLSKFVFGQVNKKDAFEAALRGLVGKFVEVEALEKLKKYFLKEVADEAKGDMSAEVARGITREMFFNKGGTAEVYKKLLSDFSQK